MSQSFSRISIKFQNQKGKWRTNSLSSFFFPVSLSDLFSKMTERNNNYLRGLPGEKCSYEKTKIKSEPNEDSKRH